MEEINNFIKILEDENNLRLKSINNGSVNSNYLTIYYNYTFETIEKLKKYRDGL